MSLVRSLPRAGRWCRRRAPRREVPADGALRPRRCGVLDRRGPWSRDLGGAGCLRRRGGCRFGRSGCLRAGERFDRLRPSDEDESASRPVSLQAAQQRRISQEKDDPCRPAPREQERLLARGLSRKHDHEIARRRVREAAVRQELDALPQRYAFGCADRQQSARGGDGRARRFHPGDIASGRHDEQDRRRIGSVQWDDGDENRGRERGGPQEASSKRSRRHADSPPPERFPPTLVRANHDTACSICLA